MYIEAESLDRFLKQKSVQIKSILYIGWKSDSNWETLEIAKKYGCEKFVILEVEKDRVEHLKSRSREAEKLGIIFDAVCGNVLEIDKIFSEQFDLVAFYHGPEHIGEKYLPTLFRLLKEKAKIGVFVGFPEGNIVDFREDINTDAYSVNDHLSFISRKAIERLGFEYTLDNGVTGIWWKGN